MVDRTFRNYRESFTGTDEDDSAEFYDGAGTIDMGGGDDWVWVSDPVDLIEMGDGQDSLMAFDDVDEIDMGDGDDWIYLLTTGNSSNTDYATNIEVLDLGAGDDKIRSLDLIGTIDFLDAGSGNDTISIDEAIDVDLGTGDDIFSADYVSDLDAGDGKDEVTLAEGAGTIDMGDGNDDLTITGPISGEIDLGDGHDTFEYILASDGTATNFYLDGGDGSDTLIPTLGDDWDVSVSSGTITLTNDDTGKSAEISYDNVENLIVESYDDPGVQTDIYILM